MLPEEKGFRLLCRIFLFQIFQYTNSGVYAYLMRPLPQCNFRPGRISSYCRNEWLCFLMAHYSWMWRYLSTPQSNTDPFMIMTFSPAVHSKTCHISFNIICWSSHKLGSSVQECMFWMYSTYKCVSYGSHCTVCLKHKHDQQSLYSMAVAKHEQTFVS